MRRMFETPMPTLLLASLFCIGGAFALRLVFAFASETPRGR